MCVRYFSVVGATGVEALADVHRRLHTIHVSSYYSTVCTVAAENAGHADSAIIQRYTTESVAHKALPKESDTQLMGYEGLCGHER